MTQTALILGGSGKIGRHAAEAFWNAGWTVRQFNRKTDDMTQAAMGCDVIVNGLNPPAYYKWEVTIPAITAQVIAAARASNATVILPGNIYNYGNQPGVLDENTPHLATTRKGRVRIAMEQSYRAAGVQTIILRAGNFIDPQGNGDIMQMLLLREISKGRVTHGGDPDTLQTYCYVPDWARAAVMLAEKRDVLDPFEDIPFPGHAFTYRDLATQVAARLGKPVRLTAFPWRLMALLSPFWPLARELHEMRYLFAMPHRIGGAKLARILPDFRASDLTTVMQAGIAPDIHPDKVMDTGGHTAAVL
ncbi:NAD-dependent epimerase/dehydratase family protein [Yoonia sp.]|uniref:NAD-dependent epimerase/dehydratase family protein n=1 Tax=Yoonia sp. TaxID=2212373 RepID=UPI003919002D